MLYIDEDPAIFRWIRADAAKTPSLEPVKEDRRLSELEQSLKTLILEEFRIADMDIREMADDMPLFGEGLGLDSLDAVEMVVLVKKHFGIEIKDRHLARKIFTSVGTLADYIRAHR